MRVLWVVPVNRLNPANMIFALRSLDYFRQEGHEIEVFYLENRMSPLSLVRSWINAKRRAREFRPERVHAQFGSVVGFFSWTLGYPLVVTFRGSDVNGDPYVPFLRRTVARFLSRWTAQRACKVICVSRELARDVLAPAASILPSPLDAQLFSPTPKDEARKRLGISAQQPLIAFFGGDRLLKRKDLATKACEEAGYSLWELNKIKPEEMPLYLGAADVLLFTSLKEGSPNIVREALACGVPVVSVNVGDVKTWLDLDEASRVVDDTPEALAMALQEVLVSSYPRTRRVDFTEISLSNHVKAFDKIYA